MRRPEELQCPGCRRVVDVSRPESVDFQVINERDAATGLHAVAILVGRVEVHRCVLCPDGQFRGA